MFTELNALLSQFSAIDLSQMDKVKLMDRTDTKFLIRTSDLLSVLVDMVAHYEILVVEGKRIRRYRNTYFDHELNMYLCHHAGKLNRYKVRQRTYLDSGLQFLEVKYKNNKGRTLKTRIASPLGALPFAEDQKLFLKQTQPYPCDALVPVVDVTYRRITLVSTSKIERVTIDVDLSFQCDAEERGIDKVAIVEVKQATQSASEFIKALRRRHIQPGALSKYCLAVALTQPQVKHNNFKLKLKTIRKLQNHDPVASSI